MSIRKAQLEDAEGIARYMWRAGKAHNDELTEIALGWRDLREVCSDRA